MKRSQLKRSPMPSRKSRIRSVNPDAKKKRQARRPKVTPAMRKAVLERDGYRCTALLPFSEYIYPDRCMETEGLEVHHEHYKQTPENPLDGLKLLCRYHHHQIESQLRPWNFR